MWKQFAICTKAFPEQGGKGRDMSPGLFCMCEENGTGFVGTAKTNWLLSLKRKEKERGYGIPFCKNHSKLEKTED
ncbi:MAG: hypothetical protein VB071_14280, partial [Lawsonibacter sp.]|nr:hypothetical protein [Lawsonibacter sp.]